MTRSLYISLLLIIALIMSHSFEIVHSQTTTTTTTPITVSIPAPRPILINKTSIIVRVENQSTLGVYYSCFFVLDYNQECTSMNITIINNNTGATLFYWSINVSNLSASNLSFISSLYMIRGISYVNITGVTTLKVVVDAYGQTFAQYIQVLPLPHVSIPIGGNVIDLSFLMALGLILGMVIRGRIRESAIGMILIGILGVFTGFIGVYIPLLVSGLLIILGLVLLYISRS
ncbi:MAG: hypothetical protein QW726_06080 [Fervidicoccaceae archaeon]